MSSLPVDASFALKSAQNQDMVQQKLRIDNLQRSLQNEKSHSEKLREACEGFESIFIQKMWEQMRKNVPKEGYLHSRDEEAYQSMFDAEFSKKMASAGGIGLADMLFEQLSQRLGESSRTTSPRNAPDSKIVPASSSPSTLRFNQEQPVIKGELDKTEIKSGQREQQALASKFDKPEEDLQKKAQQSFEEISQAMLQAELAGGEGKHFSANVKNALSPEESSILEAALNSNILEAELAQAGNTALLQGSMAGAADMLESTQDNSSLQNVSAPAPGMEKTAAVYQGDILPVFEMPVAGEIIQPFGWQEQSGGKRSWHQGVDLTASAGEGVRACMDGTVVFAGSREGYKDLLVLEHADGWRSYYGNARVDNLAPGDFVTSGTEIAKVTAAAEKSAMHLHFELRRGERAINPAPDNQQMAVKW